MLGKNDLEKLNELSKPIRDFLKEKCDPYCYVNIGWDRTSVNQSIAGIPVNKEE